MTKILNIAKHHHLLLSRPLARRLLLTLLVAMIGMMNVWGWNGEDPAWSAWEGTTIVINTSYYLFTKNQNRFLKDNNQGLGYYGDSSIPKWKVENLSSSVFNLTSENNKQFILSSKSELKWSGWNYWIEPSTNLIGIDKTNNDAKIKSDINGGYRTIYRSEKYHDKSRNVKSISDGIGIEMQKDASAEWLFVTESDYNNAAAQYYLYNVGTGQFLAFYNNGTDVKTYVTNDPSQASLVTILTKYINGEDKKSYIKAELNGTSYYMYHSKGDNTQYTSNDKFFTISSKTIGTTSGYQLILKNGDNYNRYARAGYGGFLENRSYSALDFPKDDDNNLNTLWLFISQEQYNSAAKTKLAPVHVPFTYDKYMYYDGEMTTRQSGKWDDDANKRVWLTSEADTFDIHFAGIPDTLFFRHKPKSSGSDKKFSVLESSDGFLWSEPIFEDIHTSSDDKDIKSDTVPIEPTTRYLRFCISGCDAVLDNNKGGCFYNIRVSEYHQFEIDRSSIGFGTHGTADGVFEELLALSHANAKGNISLSLSGTDATAFRVYPNAIIGGQDIIGTDYVTISYVGTDVKDHSATLTLTDGTTTKTIPITGKRISNYVPIFTWNPRDFPYYYEDSIPFVFSSTRSETAINIVSNNDIAKVEPRSNGSYTLLIGEKPEPEVGSITITVVQAGNDSIESVVKYYTFTPRQKPSLVVPFKLTKADFDEAFSANQYRSVDGYSDGKLIWIVTREQASNNEDRDWYDKGGEFFRLGGAGRGADVKGPTYHWEDKYIYFEFSGQPDSLFFDYIGYYLATGPDWYILESATGGGDPMQWSVAWHVSTNTSTNFVSSYQHAAIALKPSTRFICFCYSGNYCGCFRNIYVSANDGVYYLRDKDGKYMSRGGNEGKQAVVDDYGIAVRKTRRTTDNENYFTRFQYMDQYGSNKKYLGASGSGFLTSETESVDFEEKEVGVTDSITLKQSGNYLSVDAYNKLLLAAPVYAWYLEEYVDHAKRMQELKDAQAVTAANEFKVTVPTMAILRSQLLDNDYGRENMPLDAEHNVTEVKQLYQSLTSPNIVPSYSLLVDTGLYCISLKALNRISTKEYSYEAYLKGYDNSVAYVYAGDEQGEQHTQICSVYDFFDNQDNNPSGDDLKDYSPQYGKYFPNGTVSADVSFGKDAYYDNEVYIYVHQDEGRSDGKGTLHYGLIAPSNAECANWVCWKGFTITHFYRKEFVFDGSDSGNNSNWSNLNNWKDNMGNAVSDIPLAVHKTKIEAPVIVDVADACAHTIAILNDGVYAGTITINPDAALAVGEGGFVGATKDNLVLKANSDGQTGALRLYPGTEAPEATVQLYCKADWTGENAVWQYIGCPVSNPDFNERLFYKCWLYNWNDDGSWTNAGNWKKMEPFRGYAFTRDGRSVTPPYVFCGTLNAPSKENVSLSLTNYATGENVFANSWAAPIDITQFEESDFIGVSQTLYIFNMGNGDDMSKSGNEGGQYLPIPIFTAREVGTPTTIPSMQGFVVQPSGGVESGAKLNLNYERLVWKNEESAENQPLRSPGRRDSELQSRVCVHIMSADSLADHVFLLEKEGTGFARGYDDGYDAKKMFADGLPAIYTYDTIGKLAVSATDDVLETYLGINTTASTTYTISFSHVIGEGLGLRDLVTDSCVAITDSATYTFTASANTQNQIRFVVEEYVEPQSWNGGTSIDNVDAGDMRIWQADDLLSVTGAPRCSSVRLYNAEGKLIISEKFNGATTIRLSALPKGVYVAMVNETNVKIMR